MFAHIFVHSDSFVNGGWARSRIPYRRISMVLLALVTAIAMQFVPATNQMQVAYAGDCPLEGHARPAMAGGGYWAVVVDGNSGQVVAIVANDEGEPRRFADRESAQAAANMLAAYLCWKWYGEGEPPENGNPPPYFPVPRQPEA